MEYLSGEKPMEPWLCRHGALRGFQAKSIALRPESATSMAYEKKSPLPSYKAKD
ncbi:WD domain protein [Aspergillus luchuensis]|uniref:WD domain protein n=1 Tax=Aspergillus kawachii TaxID=1069201 RepID=A0A146FCZ8_ASPKA|nr:WD domain protein [Aspergillus luchuensis]